jgi:hypothetical protein
MKKRSTQKEMWLIINRFKVASLMSTGDSIKTEKDSIKRRISESLNIHSLQKLTNILYRLLRESPKKEHHYINQKLSIQRVSSGQKLKERIKKVHKKLSTIF